MSAISFELLGGLLVAIVTGVTITVFDSDDESDGIVLGDLSARQFVGGLAVVLVLYAVLQVVITGQTSYHADLVHPANSLAHLGGVVLDLLPGGHIADVLFGQANNIGPPWADELVGFVLWVVFGAVLYLVWDVSTDL